MYALHENEGTNTQLAPSINSNPQLPAHGLWEEGKKNRGRDNDRTTAQINFPYL